VAVDMTTATEVGSDIYDFHCADGGGVARLGERRHPPHGPRAPRRHRPGRGGDRPPVDDVTLLVLKAAASPAPRPI
jgi:hypothetical protein